jgi:hypothetical protein
VTPTTAGGNQSGSAIITLPPKDRTEPQPLAARSRLQPQRCDPNNRPTARRSGCRLL